MAQLHDTGEEFVIKNGLTVSLEVGLYNTSDNLSDGDDLSDITTEPSGSNYSRVSATFVGEDISNNWEANNASDIEIDVSDSSETVDGYFIVGNFQSDDKGDSSSQDHLLSTGDLREPINLDDGTEDVSTVTIKAGHAAVAFDNTQVLEDFESGSLDSRWTNLDGSVTVTDESSVSGTYSVRASQSDITVFWRWNYRFGASGRVQRFRFYYYGSTVTGLDGGSGPNFTFSQEGDSGLELLNSNGNQMFVIAWGNGGNLTFDIKSGDGAETIADPSWYGSDEWVEVILDWHYHINSFTVKWKDFDADNEVETQVPKPAVNMGELEAIRGVGWDGTQVTSETSTFLVDDLEVILT